MPTINIRKKDGSDAGSVALSDKVFGAAVNTGLMHQAVRTERQNSRQGTQSTKTRATVHHTTRKPFKQKGTGRARQGMTSAPHYRHGGIALGPLPRDIERQMPKKMRRAAIAAALSSKAADGAIVVVENFEFEKISTKTAAEILAKLGLTGKRILVVIAAHSEVVYKSFRNIANVEVRVAPAFSTLDVLKASSIVFTSDALEKVQASKEEA